jgi:hypothetical protein
LRSISPLTSHFVRKNSDLSQVTMDERNGMYVFVFNFFRDAILISYTAGFHEGRLFSYLQIYKNEEKNN